VTSFETALLYQAHHALHPDDLPFWLQVAGRQPGPILELGCGTGRVLIPLAQAGHTVWGIDRDAGMLAVLRQRWFQQGAALPCPPVLQADFTRFHLAVWLGLVLLPCNTYTTLEAGARRALLERVAVHLLPHGQFVMSLPNVRVLSRLRPRAPVAVDEVFSHPLDGQPVQVSSSWRRAHRLFNLTWYYDHHLLDGAVQRTRVDVQHHLEPVEVYLNEMQAAGFQLVAMYGDYDQSPFDEESPYLILILEK